MVRWIGLILVSLLVHEALSLNNGMARTPPLGFNSWNAFHGSVSEEVLTGIAHAMKDKGLIDVGYEYVNTDDGWLQLGRSSTGRLMNGSNFAHGIPALVKEIQSVGAKFGIYGAAGMTTCMSREGSLYHERIDASTYAEWGVDYLKYDDCGEVNIQSYAKFSAMRDALNATGKHILFSYEPHLTIPFYWPIYVGNAWRSGNDIRPVYESVIGELPVLNAWAHVSRPGAWGDADILEVGNKGLSLPEQRSHFAMWCLVKSPLLIGCDVTKIQDDVLSILNNTELIALNQDPLGVPGMLVGSYPGKGGDVIDSKRTASLERLMDSFANLERARDFFASASFQGITPCEYDIIHESQQWEFTEGTIRQSFSCLELTGDKSITIGSCDSSNPNQKFTSTAMTVTVAQIKASNGECVATNGSSLYTEACKVEPSDCSKTRCANSVLVNQLWYLSSGSKQLISSFTNSSVPPLSVGQGPTVTMAACNSSNPAQHWEFSNSQLKASSQGLCLSDSLVMEPCTDTSHTGFTLTDLPASNLVPLSNKGHCIDVYNFSGPGIQMSHCKAPDARFRGSQNEQWIYDSETKLMRSNVSEECCSTPSRPITGPLCMQLEPFAPPALFNIPLCIATSPISEFPQPPKPPPSVPNLPLQVWSGPLEGGSYGVVLLNSDDPLHGDQTISASWKMIGINNEQSKFTVRDLYLKEDLGVFQGSISLPVGGHDVRVLRLTPASTD